MVAHRFQEVDIAGIDRHTPELGKVEKDPADTAHPVLFERFMK